MWAKIGCLPKTKNSVLAKQSTVHSEGVSGGGSVAVAVDVSDR